MGKRKSKIIGKSRIGKWVQNRRMKKRRLSGMKKTSFRKLFTKYMTAGLCMAVILGYVGTKIAVFYCRDVVQRDFTIYFERMSEAMVQSYTEIAQEEKTEETIMSIWESQTRYWLNDTRLVGYEACLYDVSTKDRFMEQKCVVNIRVPKSPGESYVYECDWNEMQELMSDYYALLRDSEAGDENDIQEWPHVEIKDVYMKGGTFIPGEVRLVMCNRAGITKVLKEYDYTPENITGYRHIDLQEDSNYEVGEPFSLIEPTEDVDYKLIDEYMKSEEFFWNEKYFWRGEDSGYSYNFWGMKSFFTDSVTIANGKEYVLVVATDVNLWNDYKNWILAAYGGLLCLTFLVTVAVTYFIYMRRMSYYQLDTYRRETTNAMAHDLKTPLMAISGYAENLRNNVHTEKKDYYADLIVQHVEYMNDMVENILELAKVEGVSRVSEKALVDLKSQTETILKKYEILTTDKKLKVSMEGVCEIEADKACMERALENLIGNAIKYAPADTEIHIRMDKDVYEIRNQINGELQTPAEELWKPFVKGDESRNEQRGTGIGLTIVKNIADIHGFELLLQCEGQTFVAEILF